MVKHGEAPPPEPEWDNMTMSGKLDYIAELVERERSDEAVDCLEELSRFFFRRHLTTGETL